MRSHQSGLTPLFWSATRRRSVSASRGGEEGAGPQARRRRAAVAQERDFTDHFRSIAAAEMGLEGIVSKRRGVYCRQSARLAEGEDGPMA